MHRRYVLIIIAMVLGLATWSFAQESAAKDNMSPHNHRIGKTGQVTITTPVKVGNTVLPQGDYEVRHITTPNEHFVEFTRVVAIPTPGWAVRRPPQGTPKYERQKIAEASCILEPLRQKAGKTAVAVSGDEARLNKLQIKGEDVAHVF